MPDIDFKSKEDLLEFKATLLKGLDLFYEERIEEMKTERAKMEAALTKQVHRMYILAFGVITILVALIVSLTVLLYGSTVVIETESSANSYGDITLSGEDSNINAGDTVLRNSEINLDTEDFD